MSIFDNIENTLGKLVGETENLIHHPVYPTPWYLAEVDPGKLYRGSWPEGKHLEAVQKAGIRTSINLCAERQQDAAIAALGVVPYNISITDNTAPAQDDLNHLIFALTHYQPPFFIHCEQGRGRTGCMVAAYRVLVNGWSPVDALLEAKRYGLSLPVQEAFILGLKA